MRTQVFKYEVVGVLPLSELETYKDHRRLKVFYEKGVKCVNPKCDIEGTQLVVCRDKLGHTHVDLYNDDFYPMTVDHILPKVRGGNDHITNLQPMCYACNNAKGNRIEGTIPDLYEKTNKLTKSFFRPMEKQDIGLPIFKKSKHKIVCLGFLDRFVINPHTGGESFMVEGNGTSMYAVKVGLIQKTTEEFCISSNNL